MWRTSTKTRLRRRLREPSVCSTCVSPTRTWSSCLNTKPSLALWRVLSETTSRSHQSLPSTFLTSSRLILTSLSSMSGSSLQPILKFNVMIQNQIGDTTIKIIEHEIKRYVVRVKEFKQKMEDRKLLQRQIITEQFNWLLESLSMKKWRKL